MTRIAARAVQKITTFQTDTGEPMVFFQPGGLKIARRPEQEEQLHEEVARGRQLGLDVAMIPLDEASRLMPYLVTDGVRAAMHMRTDIYLEPVQVPIGYARASARLGATLLPHTLVEEILSEGAWSPAFVRRAGKSARPSWSMQPVPGSASWPRREVRQ
jgi:glycine/D-amino acid oxidase-like deaminating enzyme